MFKIYCFVFGVLLSLNALAIQDIEIGKSDVIASGTSACERTILAYPQLRDHGPAIAYGALFVEEASFNVEKLGIVLKGREQIVERLQAALATTQTLHIVKNIEVTALSNGNFEARSNFVVKLTNLNEPATQTVTITGHYADALYYDGTQCAFVTRNVNIDS